MWPPTLTPCECQQPGWCERHQCWKPAAWHLLCRRQQQYFEAWERGEGPRLDTVLPVTADVAAPEVGDVTNGSDPPTAEGTPSEPGLLRKAVNFGKAVVRQSRMELNMSMTRFTKPACRFAGRARPAMSNAWSAVIRRAVANWSSRPVGNPKTVH